MVTVDGATSGAVVVTVDGVTPGGADIMGLCTGICDVVDSSDPIDAVTSPIIPLEPSLKTTLDEPSLANCLPGN